MADWFFDSGALTANTAKWYNAKDSAVVGPAAYYDARKIKVSNPTSARITLRVNGGNPIPVNANGYAERDNVGRIEEFELEPDATVAANKVTICLSGEPLPYTQEA